MKLRHLETFIAVAQELHFGRAAKRLRVAQPAVSQTILALEDHLGVSLFDRSRRPVALTAAGAAFYEESTRILADLERASDSVRQMADGTRGQLRIGFTAACSVSSIPSAVTAFIHDNPKVELSLTQMGTAAQIEALELGRLDLGFSVLVDEDANIKKRCVVSDRLHAFLPKTHELAHRKRLEIAEVLRHPFILMNSEEERQMHREFEGLCRHYGIEPNIVLEVDHLEAMLAFVEAGLGVSFAPSAVSELIPDGVVSMPVRPRVDVDIHALWSEQRQSPTAMRFLERLL